MRGSRRVQGSRRRRAIAAGGASLLVVAGLGVWIAPVSNAAPRSNIIESVTEDYNDARGVEEGKGCKDGQSTENVGSPARAGKVAFMHTVRNCGERAELAMSRTKMGGAYWTGWSLHRPTGLAGGGIVNQWASYPGPRNGTYPCKGNGHHIISGSDTLSYALQYPKGGRLTCDRITLAKTADHAGKWVDFVQHAKWTAGGDGFMKLWMRIDGGGWKVVVDHRGPTWPGDEGDGPYFKMGAYTGEPDPKHKTHVILTDEYRLGDSGATFDDVAPGDDQSGPGEPGPTGSPGSTSQPSPDPSTPPGEQIISEDFSSPDAADRFTTRGGTWAVTDGGYRLTSPASTPTGNGNIAVHTARVDGDVTIQAKLRVDTSDTGWGDASLLFGYTDPANYSFLSLNQRNDADTSGLFRVTAGKITQLADVTTPVQLGSVHTARVDLTADAIRATLDGIAVATAKASTPAGLVGIGARNNTVTADDLVVIASGAGPSPTGNPSPTGDPSPTGSPTATATLPSGPRAKVLRRYDYETGDFSQVEQFQTQSQRCSDSKDYIFGSMFRIVQDNPRMGKYAIEHHVKNCDERAETVVEGDDLRTGKTYRMTWSMLMPKNFLGTTKDRDAGAIVHQQGSNWNPAFKQFVMRCGNPVASDMILTPDKLYYRVSYPAGTSGGKTVMDCKKYDLPPMKVDVWADFTLEVKYAAGSDAYLKLWVDGKQYIDYRGPLLVPGSKPGDVKVGLYLGDPGKGERYLRTDELRYEELP